MKPCLQTACHFGLVLGLDSTRRKPIFRSSDRPPASVAPLSAHSGVPALERDKLTRASRRSCTTSARLGNRLKDQVHSRDPSCITSPTYRHNVAQLPIFGSAILLLPVVASDRGRVFLPYSGPIEHRALSTTPYTLNTHANQCPYCTGFTGNLSQPQNERHQGAVGNAASNGRRKWEAPLDCVSGPPQSGPTVTGRYTHTDDAPRFAFRLTLPPPLDFTMIDRLPVEIMRLIVIELYDWRRIRYWKPTGWRARLAWLATTIPVSKYWASVTTSVLYRLVHLFTERSARLFLRTVRANAAIAAQVTFVSCMGFSSFEMHLLRHKISRRIPFISAKLLNPRLRQMYLDVVAACPKLSMAGHRAQDVRTMFATDGESTFLDPTAQPRPPATLPALRGLEHLMLIWDRTLRHELLPPPILPAPAPSPSPATDEGDEGGEAYPQLARLILSDLTTHEDAMRKLLHSFAAHGRLRAFESKFIDVFTNSAETPTTSSVPLTNTLLRVSPDRWLTSAPSFASNLTKLVLQDVPRLEGPLAQLCTQGSYLRACGRFSCAVHHTTAPASQHGQCAQSVWEILNCVSNTASARAHAILAQQAVSHGVTVHVPESSSTRPPAALANLKRISVEASVSSRDRDDGAMQQWPIVSFTLQSLAASHGTGVEVDLSLVCAWWREGDSFDSLFAPSKKTRSTPGKILRDQARNVRKAVTAITHMRPDAGLKNLVRWRSRLDASRPQTAGPVGQDGHAEAV
ncbi:hypothetical protein BKA62DRAFT_723199 [Auriculariales sp. MPI-PUGE-AT-0066]|nr:hypothetical protein BKA62DRAFT_723199 [Auriculariales sp. MPI-PUGE-AT-0066]